MNNADIIYERLLTDSEYERKVELEKYMGAGLILEENRWNGISIKLSPDVVNLICKSMDVIFRETIGITISISKDYHRLKLGWGKCFAREVDYFTIDIEPKLDVTINSKALFGDYKLPIGKYKLIGFGPDYLSGTFGYFHGVVNDD